MKRLQRRSRRVQCATGRAVKVMMVVSDLRNRRAPAKSVGASVRMPGGRGRERSCRRGRMAVLTKRGRGTEADRRCPRVSRDEVFCSEKCQCQLRQMQQEDGDLPSISRATR